jgi:hypothetical protein
MPEKTGHQRPQVLELAVNKPNPAKTVRVKIAMEPSPSCLQEKEWSWS